MSERKAEEAAPGRQQGDRWRIRSDLRKQTIPAGDGFFTLRVTDCNPLGFSQCTPCLGSEWRTECDELVSSQISESKLDLLRELPLGTVPETSSCKWALTGVCVRVNERENLKEEFWCVLGVLSISALNRGWSKSLHRFRRYYCPPQCAD